MGCKYVNVVIVKHQNDNRQFVFRLPKKKKLGVGTMVLCETSRNPMEMGECITDSFEIMDKHLERFYGLKIEQLKPIVGYLNPVMLGIERGEGYECSEDRQPNNRREV